MRETQNNRVSFGRWIRVGLTLLGLVIIAAALLVDVVMGGLSSGIGPLQLIAALCGLLLMIFPWLPLTLAGRGGLVLVGDSLRGPPGLSPTGNHPTSTSPTRRPKKT